MSGSQARGIDLDGGVLGEARRMVGWRTIGDRRSKRGVSGANRSRPRPGGGLWNRLLGGAGLWLVLLVLPWGAWGAEVALRPEIVLRLEPEAPQAFQPTSGRNRPTRLILQLQDATTGRALPEPAQMALELVHVKGWGLLSTGFPHVEGKKQLRGTFLAPQGRLVFDYLFPVRGRYRLTVRCRFMDPGLPGSEGREVWSMRSVHRDFPISVAEQPGNVRNARLFLALLLLFGVGVGLVFARSAAVALFLLYTGLSGQALAHAPHGHGESGIVPRQESTAGTRTGAIQARLTWEPTSPQVGQPTWFLLKFQDVRAGGLVGPARVAIRIELAEDRLPVFAGELLAPDGRLSFSLTFVDGSMHRVFLRAWPAGSPSASFAPLEAVFPVAVESLPPPAGATAKSFGLLLGTVAVGLAVGLGGGRWLFR